MTDKVAFIGLGVMGYPMAGHLAAKGYDVTVYNRNSAKAESWVDEHNGASAATPKEAASGACVIFACVGADDDLREVTLGENGIFAGMALGSVFVDHTTASADVAREMHAAAKDRDLGFIDAPVSGGQAGAENGVLTVMCGGDQEDFDKVSAAIDCYAKMCQLMGPAGAGQLTKLSQESEHFDGR